MKNKKVKVICVIIVAVVMLATAIVGVMHSIPPTAKQVFNRSICSVVELKGYTEDVGESYGTAVFLKEDGTLVSNAHVVTYKQMGEVHTFNEYSIRFADEEKYHSVSLIKYDSEKDIAVLKMQDNSIAFKPIEVGNSDEISFGDKVYAIGNGSNYGLGITQGIISIPKINIAYEGITREVIQADITISAGNSGGALLDKRGKLIGITTFRTKDTVGNVVYGLVYSIPINIILSCL